MHRNKNRIEVSRKELADIIKSGNMSELCTILNGFQISAEDPSAPGNHIESGHRLIRDLLELVVINTIQDGEHTSDKDPKREFYFTVAKYFAMKVDVFGFINGILCTIGLNDNQFSEVHFSECLWDDIENDHYQRKDATKISRLKEDQFLMLCHRILHEIETLNIQFSVPIITYVFNHNLVERSVFFFLMHAHLRELKNPGIGLVIAPPTMSLRDLLSFLPD